MFDVITVTTLVNDLCYELDIPHFKYEYSSLGNIRSVKDWLDAVNARWGESIKASEVLSPLYTGLKDIIAEQEAKPDRGYDAERKKALYLKLLDGVLSPSVIEHSDGTMSLEDYELVDDGLTKTNNINDILKLACSRTYVEGMLNKYRPSTEEEENSIFGNIYFMK